jgi:hypothetical protein
MLMLADLFTTFQAPRARITSFRMLLVVGPEIYVFCDGARGFFGLFCIPGWFLQLLIALLG